MVFKWSLRGLTSHFLTLVIHNQRKKPLRKEEKITILNTVIETIEYEFNEAAGLEKENLPKASQIFDY